VKPELRPEGIGQFHECILVPRAGAGGGRLLITRSSPDPARVARAERHEARPNESAGSPRTRPRRAAGDAARARL